MGMPEFRTWKDPIAPGGKRGEGAAGAWELMGGGSGGKGTGTGPASETPRPSGGPCSRSPSASACKATPKTTFPLPGPQLTANSPPPQKNSIRAPSVQSTVYVGQARLAGTGRPAGPCLCARAPGGDASSPGQMLERSVLSAPGRGGYYMFISWRKQGMEEMAHLFPASAEAAVGCEQSEGGGGHVKSLPACPPACLPVFFCATVTPWQATNLFRRYMSPACIGCRQPC